MNKLDLAKRLAKQSHRSRAKAADEVDAFVYHLLKDLKRSGKEEQPDPSMSGKEFVSAGAPVPPKEKR